MAILSWGEPKVEIAPYVGGVLPGTPTWVELAQIKQGTATLETEQGDKTEALDEGGDVVDVRFGKSKYTFSCSLFIKKGDSKPIEDTDGVITTNYAMRLTPEDNAAMGFMLPKCNVSVQETWSSADGGLWVYTFSAIKPASGTTLQRFAGGFSVSPTMFNVPKSASTRVVDVVSSTQPTASGSAAWLTPTVTGEAGAYEVTVAVGANSGAARTGTVTITVSGNSQTVTFSQAAGN